MLLRESLNKTFPFVILTIGRICFCFPGRSFVHSSFAVLRRMDQDDKHFIEKIILPKNMLSIVSTPIGNLEDITLRALRILTEADYIACEDTRMTGQLLQHYDIENGGRLMSFHSHSGFSKVEKIIELLQAGKHIALVSDAGTPGISDPGFILIKKAIEAGITVTPIP